MSLPEAKFPPQALPGLEYTRTISFIFENPNWLMNALWSFLCQVVAGVIPIVPQMVLVGYQFEIVDSLLASRGARYPDFDINRLGDYLGRGVWPVLAMLVASLVWGLVFSIIAGCGGGCIVAIVNAGGKEGGPVLAVLGILVGIVLLLAVIVLLVLMTTPVMLRAGIAQDFAAAFDFGWISDFLHKMWIEVVLATLFVTVVAIAAGVLTCGLGWLIAAPLIPFVHSHFWYQFYVLYLDRGGIPIPVKAMAIMPGYPPKPL